jgi:acetyl-CoA C-acetyltransferase
MLHGSSPRRVAIIGGVRIPFARPDGAYAAVGNPELLTATLRGLVEAYSLQGQQLGEIAAGALIKHTSQWSLARACVPDSGLAATTPGVDLQRACATGLEAAIQLGNKIALGQIDSGVAAGVDSVSDPPVAFPKVFQELLLQSYRGKTAAARWRPWLGLRLRHLRPVLPGIAEPGSGLTMGASAELLIKRWGIRRADQDQLAMQSHERAAAAYEAGFYRGLVRSHLGIERDAAIRPDASLTKLGALTPIFATSDGTLTAGNSAPMADGAASVLLASEEWARQRNLPVLAYLSHARTAAIDVTTHRDALLIAACHAVALLLADARLSLQDFDAIEIHEAFAGQVLATLAAWADPGFCREHLGLKNALGVIDRARLNVKGGSLAFGHPFAATGARMLATLAKTLDETRGRRGLIAICTADGMGVAAILER